jgi:hypothetical protein
MKHRLMSLTAAVLLCLAAAPVWAQQNLFNIPSGDITPKGRYFYQHQLNLYSRDKMESKGHFVYGLGAGWEIGANLVNVALDPTPTRRLLLSRAPGAPAAPLLAVTAQKQVEVSKTLAFSMGTQMGVDHAKAFGIGALAHKTYAMAVLRTPGLKLVGGTYLSNDRFVGRGQNLGFILGGEWHVAGPFALMADVITGDHTAAAAVLGGMVTVSKRLQLCAGYLAPVEGSAAQPGLVFEVNILGFDAQ